jgi:DNA repair exonuclease SbcCD ATPase subunit
MRITRLRLTRFKTHEDLEIVPAAGLTIVRGPNEAGKSTIQKAIELVLFRKADTNREDLRRAWAWGSAEPPAVELDFEAYGTAGTLRKRFGGARSEGELTLGEQTITDYTLIGDKMASFLGVPTEAFYRATASVGHSELEAVAGDEPAIGDRLQKAISGADRGTGKAKKKLETAIRRYKTEGHKNPGLLKVSRGRVAELDRELVDGEAALTRLQADRAHWVEAHERREELDLRLSRQRADLSEAQRADSVSQKRDAAQDRYDRLKRAVELTQEANELRADLPSTVPLAQLRSTVSYVQGMEFKLSELEAEVDAATEMAAAEGPDLVPPRPMRWLAGAALLVLLGWAAMYLLRDAGAVGGVVVAVIGLGVIVTLVQAFRLARKRRLYGLVMKLAEDAAVGHQEQLRGKQDEFRRGRREMGDALESLGVDDVRAAEALLAATEKHTEKLAQIEGELRGLGVENSNIRRLREERDQVANEAEQAAHALAAMGSLADDPAATSVTAQRQVAETTPARDAARSEEDQALGRVDANQVDAELVAGLAERLAGARERQAELERRMGVYQGTLEAIDAAERATLKTAARYLEERMGPTISVVTDGRYDEIEVDEKSLAFKVRAPETGELVAVDQLSQGTADQLYLAARLGLVRLVTLDRRPPLILDDPFVTFDSARGERALRLIKQLAHDHDFQVMFLTCSDRFDTLADELVVLPGPTQERVLANPRGATPVTGQSSATPATAAPAQVAADGSVDTPEQRIFFEPDPRPNPDPVAPLHVEDEEPVDRASFEVTEPVEVTEPAVDDGATGALASPRQSKAASQATDGPEPSDPLESPRRAAHDTTEDEHDAGVADPFRLDDEGPDEDSD